MSGGLRQALGRAPGRRRQRDAQSLLAEDRDDAADDGGLAHAGATGHDHDLVAKRAPDRGRLLRGQGDVGLGLVPGERALEIDGHRRRGRFQQPAQSRGAGELGAIQGGVVDRLAAGVVVGHHVGAARGLLTGSDQIDGHVTLAGQAIDRGAHQVVVDAEQRGRPIGQALARDVDVAPARGFLQHVADATLDADVGVVGDAQRRGELVRRQKADAPDVERQTIRVGAHLGDRGRAVALVDARGERGRDAVALQEHHHLAHLALRGPRLANRPRARGADAGDLADARGIAIQDLQRVDAEARDDTRRELGPDALDQARAQVTPDALDGLGRKLGVAGDAELRSEARVGFAMSGDAQARPDRDAQQTADDGHGLARAGAGGRAGGRGRRGGRATRRAPRPRVGLARAGHLDGQSRDGELAPAAREDDALHDPLDGLLGRARAVPSRAAARVAGLAGVAGQPVEEIHEVPSSR